MRVLFISLVSVTVLFIVLLAARFWGLGQRYPEYQHPFFEGAPLAILTVESTQEMEEALQQKSDFAFWLDVSITKDQKLIVFGHDFDSKEMAIEAYRGPKSVAYSYEDVLKLRPEVRELKTILSAFPQQRFVLNIVDNVEKIHEVIRETLKDLSPEKRILLQSPYNAIMTSTKELEPFWLYGCSKADLMRFLTFESMWILPATPFKGDVYIAPFVLLGRPAFHESTLEEVRRRNKKIILGPALNKTEFDDAARLKTDAVIVEKLSDFLEWSRP